MVLKPDQERVRTLLCDTITLLCKNGLSFKSKFSIDAVIGVTLDEADAFYVSMNQVIPSDKPALEQDQSSSNGEEFVHASSPRKRKRRGSKHKQPKQVKVEEAPPGTDGEEQEDDVEEDDGNIEDSSNMSATFKAEVDENNKDIVFIKQEVEAGESWQESVDESAGFLASDSNYSMEGGVVWMQGSQSSEFHQSPSTSTSLAPTQHPDAEKPIDMLYHSMQTRLAFHCELCGTSCSTKNILKKHMDRHLGIFPYYCSICSKGCTSTNQLKGHMVDHTGEKEFKCKHCGKDFKYNYQLTRHKPKCINV